MSVKRRKIAIINQRYGLEVNGGSEYHARILAEQLAKMHDVEVITTCAKEYDTWKNEYPEGDEVINGITIHRFPVDHPRDFETFQKCELMRIKRKSRFMTWRMEQKWIDEQGPYCPKAIQYIKDNYEQYDTFIFVTYLYYLTVMGLKEVADKSILVSTAHDEPFLRMRHYRNLFKAPRGYFFNTEEEKDLIFNKFKTQKIPHRIGGVGIETPEVTNPEKFKKEHGLNHYIIYVGRIDYGKNCQELFDFFDRYKSKYGGDLKLVLMGKEMMEVPEREDILSLGFVNEEEKYDGMAGADFLVLPSIYESMSIVVLDSLKLGVPVLVNGKCEVLKAHCEKGNGGLFYQDYESFEQCMLKLLKDENLRKQMGDDGSQYVEKNYQWDAILKRLNSLMDECIPIK